MGSVFASWRARTGAVAVQDSLAEYLKRLSHRHQLRRAESMGLELPAFSKIISAQRSEGLPSVPDERWFENQGIHGRVVVNFDLFPEESTANAPGIPDRRSALADAEARGLRIVHERDFPFVILDKAALSGVDFRIFDPRDLYPGADRMSFVFARDTGWPLLDGLMVYVDEAAACRTAEIEVLRTADWHLSLPYIHLRYFLEEWSDRFFAWVRRYFISELEFMSYEPNSQFDVYDSGMAHLEEQLGRDPARELSFAHLLEEYDAELGKWKSDLSGWARQEQNPASEEEPS